MKIIFSKKCLEYHQPGHPESPKRVRDSYSILKDKFEFINTKEANDSDILAVHTRSHLEAIRDNNFLDYDTPNYNNIIYYAKLSAGAAIKAMELCFDDKTFSLMRPPGHHAGYRVMGFCYFNNIAIAITKALKNGVDKAAIIDIDVHHGNGTQEIFLGNKKVIYLSLHQSPHYPNTGLINKDNCYNYPLPAGTSEKKYLKTLEEGLSIVKNFDPEIIGVSAGFDSYYKDPLGGFELMLESYQKIATLINSLDKPIFCVLEGGYSDDLGRCILNYLKGFD